MKRGKCEDRCRDWCALLSRIVRIFCCAVTVAAITIFCWRLGAGVVRVRNGEITSAQMLEELGAWLCGRDVP
jgi:hypothetical protein